MKRVIYPPALKPGDTVGVTAPSTGIGLDLEERLQFCIKTVRNFGFNVRLGNCLRGSGIVSASAPARATELTQMLADDDIAIIVPPWGGELLINILPLLDFAALGKLKPKWMVG